MKEQQEKLEVKKVIAGISPRNRSHLFRVDIFDTIDSTNTQLLRQGKQEIGQRKSGWVCSAEQQTQGRGRQGKVWFSPYAANLYCSLSWSFPAVFAGLSALSLVCGVLLCRSLQHFGVGKGLGLKWPNDVLFSGRKLAGILLENLASPQQNWVVIGLGLNFCLPENNEGAWIDLEEILGKAPSRNALLSSLLDQLLEGLALFESQGLQAFLPAARELDLLRYKEVFVQTPQGSFAGLAQGLSDEGELLIVDAEGQAHQFSYGEVSVRLQPASLT